MHRFLRYFTPVLFFIQAPLSFVNADTGSPYSGQQSRSIKALSTVDIDDFLAGRGMGYAKAAELNHFPGPRHVLDMVDQLKLTAKQVTDSQQIFTEMQHGAIDIGKQIIASERQLDDLFATQTVEPAILESLLADIGLLQSKLRLVHLNAHLKQKAVLSAEQVQQYDDLRGYHSPSPETDAHQKHPH